MMIHTTSPHLPIQITIPSNPPALKGPPTPALREKFTLTTGFHLAKTLNIIISNNPPTPRLSTMNFR